MDTKPKNGHILFLDKVFLQPFSTPLRGVELFNLLLLKDLKALGARVHVYATKSWAPVLEPLRGGNLELHLIEDRKRKGWAIASLFPVLAGKKFETFLLGNVGNSMIPVIWWLRYSRAFNNAVMIANREADAWFVRTWRKTKGKVLAVNKQIAGGFTAGGCKDVYVDYGITPASAYYPAPSFDAGGSFRFVVLGDLDSSWKGADTAIEAYQMLDPAWKAKATLHLIAYRVPPKSLPEGVIAYPWQESSKVPDLLRSMHAMVCPSRDEGKMMETFSQAMVQGMLTGLPILTSNLPILTEKLDQGGGLIANNTRELSEHMVRLIQDPERSRSMGEQARKIALERYVWDTARFLNRYC